MSVSAFERMATGVLRHLGQDALLLQGATHIPCRAHIERGVQVMGRYDDAVFERDVVTLPASVNAKVGDYLQHPFGTFVLDSLLTSNGYTHRFTIQPAP